MSHPVAITRTHDGIRIAFSDGTARRYAPRDLQRSCPCANCRERRDADASRPPDPLAVLPREQLAPPTIAGMRPVGHYAYHIDFTSGCSRGIYEFELLKTLGQPDDAPAAD